MRWRYFVIFSALVIGLPGCSNDVSNDAKLSGGYRKGQTLRLLVDAYAYKFKEVDHPAEAGAQITFGKNLNLEDSARRAEWERRNASTIIARLPPGTVLRVERIDYVHSFDTAVIVPRAVVINGALHDQKIALSGISREIPSASYPNSVEPNPDAVEVVVSK